jgi:hypothetical protein
MTTIGFGNATARSVGGRAMVYTLGFLSILLFATITARAGKIVSSIFDEHAARFKLGWMKIPAVALMARAALYSLWLLVIAQHYQLWQHKRLDNTDVGLNDSYWFAYISTTTVGLGDFYLDPEVISYGDLFAFPLLFLIGFTLLAVFLDKFAESLVWALKGTEKKLKKSAELVLTLPDVFYGNAARSESNK